MKRYFKVLDSDYELMLVVTVTITKGDWDGLPALMDRVSATMSGTACEVTEEQAEILGQKLAGKA